MWCCNLLTFFLYVFVGVPTRLLTLPFMHPGGLQAMLRSGFQWLRAWRRPFFAGAVLLRMSQVSLCGSWSCRFLTRHGRNFLKQKWWFQILDHKGKEGCTRSSMVGGCMVVCQWIPCRIHACQSMPTTKCGRRFFSIRVMCHALLAESLGSIPLTLRGGWHDVQVRAQSVL